MSVHELHPEELLERAARGTATEEEMRRLQDHAARCVACRFELQVRADFAAEVDPFQTAAEVQRFVTTSLLRAGQPLESQPRSSPPAVRRRSPRRGVLVVAAALLLASGMAAAQWNQLAPILGLAESALEARAKSTTPAHQTPFPVPPPGGEAIERAEYAETPGTDPSPSPRQVERSSMPRVESQRRAASRPRTRAKAPPAPRAEVPAGDSSPFEASTAREPAPSDSPQSSNTRQGSDGPQPHGAPRGSEKPQTSGVEDQARVRDPADASSAGELFERAAAARRRAEVREALTLYHALRTRFPESYEARLSLAVTARLLLDRGENRAALADFEAYLSTGDRALREEAMVGRSQALERLGRDEEHRSSVEALRLAYPESAYVKALDKRRISAAP